MLTGLSGDNALVKMAITNLNQYYQAQKQALPSVANRATTYKQAGYNDAYVGSGAQNANLLGYLQKNQSGQGGNTTGGNNAASTANPTNPVNPFSQNLANASTAFSPLSQQESNLTTQQTSLNNAQTQDLEQRLKENAGYATNAINENQNNLGLLQSGSTTNAVAGMQRDVANQLNQADIQNSINNANLALQGAQFNTQTVLPGELNYANNLVGGQQGSAASIQNLLMNPLFHTLGGPAIDALLQAYGLSPQEASSIEKGQASQLTPPTS